MKIYTRTGDDGTTSLFAGGRTGKDAARLHAYGTIDELNSILGLVLAHNLTAPELAERLQIIQNDLFVVGGDLATPIDSDVAWVIRVQPPQVTRLENEIDSMEASLPPLKNFILPGGSLAGAQLHVARTVCRRAERWIVALSHTEKINESVLHYTNRLSDWLFVAARLENKHAGQKDTVWLAPSRK